MPYSLDQPPFLNISEVETLLNRCRDCARLSANQDYKLIYTNLAQMLEHLAEKMGWK